MAWSTWRRAIILSHHHYRLLRRQLEGSCKVDPFPIRENDRKNKIILTEDIFIYVGLRTPNSYIYICVYIITSSAIFLENSWDITFHWNNIFNKQPLLYLSFQSQFHEFELQFSTYRTLCYKILFEILYLIVITMLLLSHRVSWPEFSLKLRKCLRFFTLLHWPKTA